MKFRKRKGLSEFFFLSLHFFRTRWLASGRDPRLRYGLKGQIDDRRSEYSDAWCSSVIVGDQCSFNTRLTIHVYFKFSFLHTSQIGG